MEQKTKNSLALIALAITACVIGYKMLIVNPGKRAESAKQYAQTEAAASDRFRKWAYVAKSKEIAPGETVKLIVIPEAAGFEPLDTKCLIYTNQELKTSSMICPNADQFNLREPE